MHGSNTGDSMARTSDITAARAKKPPRRDDTPAEVPPLPPLKASAAWHWRILRWSGVHNTKWRVLETISSEWWANKVFDEACLSSRLGAVALIGPKGNLIHMHRATLQRG